MTDEDLLNTDLVITGRDGFRLNLDSPEWRGAKNLCSIGRVLVLGGSAALGYMLASQILSLIVAATSSLGSTLAITVILLGFVLRRIGDRSMTKQIVAATSTIRDWVES